MFSTSVLLTLAVGIALNAKMSQYQTYQSSEENAPLFADRVEASHQADDCKFDIKVLLISYGLIATYTLLEFIKQTQIS